MKPVNFIKFNTEQPAINMLEKCQNLWYWFLLRLKIVLSFLGAAAQSRYSAVDITRYISPTSFIKVNKVKIVNENKIQNQMSDANVVIIISIIYLRYTFTLKNQIVGLDRCSYQGKAAQLTDLVYTKKDQSGVGCSGQL